MFLGVREMATNGELPGFISEVRSGFMPNTAAITSHKPFHSRLYPCISCKLSMGCGFPMCRSQNSGHRSPLGVNLSGFTSGSPSDDVCDAAWKQCVDPGSDPGPDGWMFFSGCFIH